MVGCPEVPLRGRARGRGCDSSLYVGESGPAPGPTLTAARPDPGLGAYHLRARPLSCADARFAAECKRLLGVVTGFAKHSLGWWAGCTDGGVHSCEPRV